MVDLHRKSYLNSVEANLLSLLIITASYTIFACGLYEAFVDLIRTITLQAVKVVHKSGRGLDLRVIDQPT